MKFYPFPQYRFFVHANGVEYSMKQNEWEREGLWALQSYELSLIMPMNITQAVRRSA